MTDATLTTDLVETAPQDAPDGQEGRPGASEPASEVDPEVDSAEDADEASEASGTATDAPETHMTHEQARAEFEDWSQRRQELQAKVSARNGQIGALDSVISQARKDAILGKAEIGAAAPLVAERATLQTEIDELSELVSIALQEEQVAQARYGLSNAQAHVDQTRALAAQLAERAAASDEAIDAALVVFLGAMEERWDLYQEGQALLKSATESDAQFAELGWPEVGRLDSLRTVPFDWSRIPHCDGRKYPRHYRIDL